MMPPLFPAFILTAAALTLFMWDAFRPGRRGETLALSAAALLTALWGVTQIYTGPVLASFGGDATFHGMVSVLADTRLLMGLLLVSVLIVLALCADFKPFQTPGFAWGSFAGLLLLSTVGLLLLVAARDLLLVLIAIELISVTSFILTGFLKDDRRSSEAALKYFLVGAFSTGLMIYGLSLVYGITGTTRIEALLTPAPGWPLLPFLGAVLLVLVGIGFKLALAPFHMWAPDVYEGAPTPVTAFLSVAPKTAAFGLLLNALANHGALHLTPILAALSALTMTVGNLAALRQTNLKRLLAYSSVAQMGYVLMGFTAAGPAGFQAVLLYLSAYLFTNLGAFACVLAVAADAKTEDLQGFRGLAGRSLPLALAMTVFMLSLTGIPPLFGFIGKYSLFAAVVQTPGLLWLAVVGVVNSVVSFAYYFSVVREMFLVDASRRGAVPLAPALGGSLLLGLLMTLAGGLAPNVLIAFLQTVLRP